MGEFELIERFFLRARPASARVPLGAGDDCALIAPAPGMQLAVSTDMLVEGRHFLAIADPARLGHKALAVNLSDLAACGARPLGFTLSISLPAVDPAWLEGFARGLFALADEQGCELVGGDTTRGPLAMSITVFGEVPAGRALLRRGARAGDDLYVSGTLGDARLALEVLRGTLSVPAPLFELARRRMDQPTPRVALGQALRGLATSAVDVSDGLLGDLGHVLRLSRVGATVWSEAALPLLAARAQAGSATDLPGEATQLEFVLAGGDDYELLFTAPADQREAVAAAAAACATPVTRIGRIDDQPGVRVLDGAGREVHGRFLSFDHFA